MPCRSRVLPWWVIALLGIGSLLAACGQKGPLYLSKPDPAQQQEEQRRP